jgi:dihydrolipoamide dehydrogenase
VEVIRGRQTADSLAGQLGEELLFGGDANRVNTFLDKLAAITPEQVQAVAKKYLTPQRATTMTINPDPLGKAAQAAKAEETANAPVKPSDEPVKAREVTFPSDWPKRPVVAKVQASPSFEKGTESTTANGVRVIVMPDRRLPLVNWSVTTRRGSHADPKGKEGLASLTGDMLRRGAGGATFAELNNELESRGITLEVSDGGDYSRVSGSSTSENLEHGLRRTRDVLLSPAFPADEFEKLKQQSIESLVLSLDSPSTVAGNDLDAALFGDSPLGRSPTPASVKSITLDDVKAFYKSAFRPQDAVLVISGDVSVEQGQKLAQELTQGWEAGELPPVAYDLPKPPAKRKILLVDRPSGKQSVVRIGIPAYTNKSDEKFPGSVAGQILTSGIDSRLGRYVRAEKGLAYGVHGVFQPGRHAGAFVAGTDTAVESTADAVEAIFKVLNDMRSAPVTAEELAEAQSRVAGGMVMGMQTIGQQAGYRVEAILNGYPIDYYDQYPQRIGAVTTDQVREVMQKYVKDGEVVIVVVAPASAVKEQLQRLGEVEVIPMPAQRDGNGDAPEGGAAAPEEGGLTNKRPAGPPAGRFRFLESPDPYDPADLLPRRRQQLHLRPRRHRRRPRRLRRRHPRGAARASHRLRRARIPRRHVSQRRVHPLQGAARLDREGRDGQARLRQARHHRRATSASTSAKMMGRKDEVVKGLTGGVGCCSRRTRSTTSAATARSPRRAPSRSRPPPAAIRRRSRPSASSSPPARRRSRSPACRTTRSSSARPPASSPSRRSPSGLLVVGAGYIGVEMGSVWNRLGSEVIVLEFLDHSLVNMDRELAGKLQRQLEGQGLKFRFKTVAQSAKVENGKVKVSWKSGDQTGVEEVDRVLVAVGRRPVTDNLGLQELGVEMDKKGYVKVDPHTFETSVPGVFAIGDVIGGLQLAHKAEEEGVAAVETMAGGKGHVNYHACPMVVYTHPELAQVGLTEADAAARGPIKVGRFPLIANGRARGMGETDGMVKVIGDAKTDRLLGVHVLGPPRQRHDRRGDGGHRVRRQRRRPRPLVPRPPDAAGGDEGSRRWRPISGRSTPERLCRPLGPIPNPLPPVGIGQTAFPPIKASPRRPSIRFAIVGRLDPAPRRNEPFARRLVPFARRLEPSPRRLEPFASRLVAFARRLEPFGRRLEPSPKRLEPFLWRLEPSPKRPKPFR